MTNALRITLAQINPVVGALSGNKDKIIGILEECREHADIVIFPELSICGYPPEDLILKPSFIRSIDKHVQDIVQWSTSSSMAIILPVPVTQEDKIYNAAHIIENGKITATQHKVHLPNYGVFDEQRLFSAGKMPDVQIIAGHKIGLLICEDMWHDDVAAHLQDNGAQLFISVNASPFDYRKTTERHDIARKNVSKTGLPLIYLNQWGGQDELVFDGTSFIMDDKGDIILECAHFAEDLCHTDWEYNAKNNAFSFQRSSTHQRQSRSNDSLESIYMACVTGLRDYVTKAGFPGVLLGLSGGIDSALTAEIAVDALGADAVHCVMMPSKYTSEDSLNDARKLAENLNVRLDNIAIEKSVSAFENTLSGYFDDTTPGITFENLQSRSRGLILMALSNASGKMVMSTGNKSEMAVGYATLYGDMCGGFNPLKDLYKTQVFALSQWRNAHKPANAQGPEGIVMPVNIIEKPPTAELRDNQTDQDSLPPYDILDNILECLIEYDMGIQDIVAKGHDKQTVLSVWKMLDRSEYKRRQAPPGVKITSRAFGRDRRYPIINHFAHNIEAG